MSKAAVEELAALRIPVLREPDEKSVTEWIQDVETYQAQGGKRKPREWGIGSTSGNKSEYAQRVLVI